MKKPLLALGGNPKVTAAFDRLITIVDELRENCPWDKKQTWASLRHLTVEELYELSDAIVDNKTEDVKEELGDIMLHIALYVRIGAENNRFTMTDVLNTICDKLIERHPHVYGKEKLEDEEAVKKNWERIKLKKGNRTVLQGVPKALPAMVKATRIQDKVRNVGFDWEDVTEVLEKVEEEIGELKKEMRNSPSREKIRSELGDVFFSLINYARFVGIDPEEALEHTNKKFIKRFRHIESESKRMGIKVEDMTAEEMNAHWEKAKSME